MPSRRRAAAAVAALLTGLVLIASTSRHEARALPANRPNILVIIADDQHPSTFTATYMPAVFSQLVGKGVRFDRGYVNSSVCCPSRSEILTGLYEHHTGVDFNGTPLTKPTIVEALHDLGYRTMLSGKYLNSAPCDPRPEFDRWVCQHHDPPSSTTLRNPTLNVDGTWSTFNGYTTQITADFVSSFIRSTPTDRPFFAMYSPTSPRLGGGDDRYGSMPVPALRPPSYDEETRTADTPFYMQRPPLTGDEKLKMDRWYRGMARSVRGFDDSIGSVLASLGSRAQDTLVVYINDNGFLLGEHRRVAKMVPYEESTHVPFVVRYPRLLAASQSFRSPALAMNIDIPATIADVLGIPWGADGRSLVPLITRRTTGIRNAALLVWCRGVHTCAGGQLSDDFVIPEKSIPSYWAMATDRYKYVEYRSGERELYDLAVDPFELRNLAYDPAAATLVADLSRRLAALHGPVTPETTIVSGPRGTVAGTTFRFRYFTQSRLATYRCRLDRNGVAGTWSACGAQGTSVGPLARGSYVFHVVGTDERGISDATPATRSFSVT